MVKKLILLFMLLFLVGCTYEVPGENSSQQENQTLDIINETLNESVNETEIDNSSEEVKVEGLYENKISENYIWYEFKLSENDTLIVSLNGEEIFNSQSNSKQKGILEQYPERYNTLEVEYVDSPDNQAVSIDMRLNNETSMFSWSQFNSSGKFEVPLEFIVEE